MDNIKIFPVLCNEKNMANYAYILHDKADNQTLIIDAAEANMLKEQVNEILGTLAPREAMVLILRYGLRDGRPRTLEEVGKVFNVTRERIRQIEAKALRRLKHPNKTKKLRDFLDK